MIHEGSVTDKIYRGGATRYSNGTRMLTDFEKGEKRICAIANPYWVGQEDVVKR